MGNSPVNASLSIDAGYIEAEVQRIVKAAIVENTWKQRRNYQKSD